MDAYELNLDSYSINIGGPVEFYDCRTVISELCIRTLRRQKERVSVPILII